METRIVDESEAAVAERERIQFEKMTKNRFKK